MSSLNIENSIIRSVFTGMTIINGFACLIGIIAAAIAWGRGSTTLLNYFLGIVTVCGIWGLLGLVIEGATN